MKIEVSFPDYNPKNDFDIPDCDGKIEVHYTYGQITTYPLNKEDMVPLRKYWNKLVSNESNQGKIIKAIFHYDSKSQVKIINEEEFNPIKIKWASGFKGLPTPYYPIKCPSVTGVINDLIEDPGWDEFVKDVGEETAIKIRNSAGHRGTAMHTFLEHFIKKIHETKDPSLALKHSHEESMKFLLKEGIPMDKIDLGREMFHNFYYSEYSKKYLDLMGSEFPVYSPYLYFRGIIDVFYNEQGYGKVVTDFKNSSKPIERGSIKELKYKLQIGGYALAVEDMYKSKGTKYEMNKGSILVMQTKSSLIQEIICEGKELKEQKEEFKKLVKQWHINNGTGFLFNKK